jgi:hypothetical protein
MAPAGSGFRESEIRPRRAPGLAGNFNSLSYGVAAAATHAVSKYS